MIEESENIGKMKIKRKIFKLNTLNYMVDIGEKSKVIVKTIKLW